MQRDGQFDRAQIGGQMSSGLRNGFEQKGPQFVGHLLQLVTL
jgi:hypothetical protein